MPKFEELTMSELILYLVVSGVCILIIFFWTRFVHGIEKRESNQKEIIRLLKKIANEEDIE